MFCLLHCNVVIRFTYCTVLGRLQIEWQIKTTLQYCNIINGIGNRYYTKKTPKLCAGCLGWPTIASRTSCYVMLS